MPNFYKKAGKGLLTFMLIKKFSKEIWKFILISGITGGIIKLLTSPSVGKKFSKKAKMAEGSGVYGAVAIAKVFKGADFPMTKDDIIQKYGDKEIEYHVGKKEKLTDILHDIPEQSYNRTTDLEHALHETLRNKQGYV
jgi:hypothetical protein